MKIYYSCNNILHNNNIQLYSYIHTFYYNHDKLNYNIL